MAITINSTTFAKRHNSTAIPSTFAHSYDVALKGACSYDRPIFLLSEDSFLDNYVQWGSWYYFVEDVIVQRNNLLEISCTLDALATHKAEILASSQFVAYDTTPNSEISDKRLSTKTTATRLETVGNVWQYITDTPCVMVNVVGEGSCATYALTVANAAKLLDSANVQNWLDQILEPVDPSQPPAGGWVEKVADAITNGFRSFVSSGSAGDCIKSAFIMPIDPVQLPGVYEEVVLGLYHTNVYGKRMTLRTISDAQGINIPWQATDWRRNAPYHEFYLYIPYVGVISYPASALVGTDKLSIGMALDISAGDCIFTVGKTITQATAIEVIGQYSANIAGSYAIGSSNITPRQVATAIGSAGAAVAASVLMPAGMAAAAVGTAGIVGEFNALQPIPSSVGGSGGAAAISLQGVNCRMMSIFHDTSVAPDSVSAIIGTPTMAVKSLSGLSGYCECRNAHVSITGHDTTAREIEEYMNGGFYIE